MSVEVPRPGPSHSHPPATRISETVRDVLLQGHPVLGTDTSCTPRVFPRQRRACPDSAAVKGAARTPSGALSRPIHDGAAPTPARGACVFRNSGADPKGCASAWRGIENKWCASSSTHTSGTPASGTMSQGVEARKYIAYLVLYSVEEKGEVQDLGQGSS